MPKNRAREVGATTDPGFPIPTHALTQAEIQSALDERLKFITEEFKRGFEFVKKYQKSITIFGSARFDPANVHYKAAYNLASKLSKLGYAIVTGGGPGVMEAANKGAFEAGGQSVGLSIDLPAEQTKNLYITERTQFHYFFSRKVALTFAAEAFVFLPGGYGTLNEFFETITLLQTKKVPKVPVILYGRDFWGPVNDLIHKTLYVGHQSIDKKDMDLYFITDDEGEVIEVIKKAPVIQALEFRLNGNREKS